MEEEMQNTTTTEKGLLVVARFQDGRTLKGTTHDFAPGKTEFHLHEGTEERSGGVKVTTASLKALFFVRTYEGNPDHRDKYSFEESGAQGGRRIRVRFRDGEVMAGYTMGYSAQKPGFFLLPADPDGNNSRVYVVNAAVAGVEWV